MRRPPLPSLRRGARALASLLALAAGCTGSGEVSGPANGGGVPRARLSVAVSVTAAGEAQLRLSPWYPRQDGTRRALPAFTVPLGGGREEQVAQEIEFGACLADQLRAGSNGAAPAPNACVLSLTFALVVDGAVVDSQTVGPVTLSPGATVAAGNVALREVAVLQLTLADGTPVPAGVPLAFPVGDRRALLARVTDGAGRVRPAASVAWQATPAAVATVSAAGVVTGVAPGVGTLVASSGGVEVAVPLRVLRAPASLRVEAAAGSTGRVVVTSSPAGILCTLANGARSGSCEGSFPGDTTVTLQAVAEGLTELRGLDGDCTGTAPCALPMTAPRTVRVASTARFPLMVSGAGAGTATVVSVPEGIRCTIVNGVAASTGCMAAVRTDTDVTLVVQPVPGTVLAAWSGDCAGTGDCTLRMTAPRTVTAQLGPPRLLRVGGAGSGSGVITSAPAGISCTITNGAPSGAGCAAEFPQGTAVTLSAAAAVESDFTGWSGACDGAAGCTVVLAADRAVTGTFDARVRLTVAGGGTGSGTVTSSPAGLSCVIDNGTPAGTGCSATFPRGRAVTLTAVPAVGSDFSRWEGACTGPDACTLPMAAAAQVASVFEARQRLSIGGTGTGSGTVTSSPAGISCVITDGQAAATGCSALFPRGGTVALTATPASGSDFGGWVGACGGTDACEVRMAGPVSATARLTRRRALTVTPSGAGSGTIVSFPAGIRCVVTNGVPSSGGCSALFPDGAVVSLSIATGTATTFGGWAGACGGTGDCQVTLGQAVTVSVTLAAWPRLTVRGSGDGDGEVTSVPEGIACRITESVTSATGCSRQFPPGTQITLTGEPSDSSTFEGWSGACSGTAPCMVTLTADRAVTAIFGQAVEEVRTFRLTVEAAPNSTGGGTVTSSPTGMNCSMSGGTTSGPVCFRDYPAGTRVTLFATPASGSTFVMWGGACISSTCIVVMNDDIGVTARFNQPTNEAPGLGGTASNGGPSPAAAPVREGSSPPAGRR